jgi:hypothetical protein
MIRGSLMELATAPRPAEEDGTICPKMGEFSCVTGL